MCILCHQELIYYDVPWYQYSCYYGEAWTDNRQGKSFPNSTLGEAPATLSHWPDGFRWFVNIVDQNQCRIRAWADCYRSKVQDNTTQERLTSIE